MTKSALVGLIHDKTMRSPSVAYGSNNITTLMSTDVDILEGIGEMIHETWAQVIEVLIGIILLASQVGWIWPLPLFLIYGEHAPYPLSNDANSASMLPYESICRKTSST